MVRPPAGLSNGRMPRRLHSPMSRLITGLITDNHPSLVTSIIEIFDLTQATQHKKDNNIKQDTHSLLFSGFSHLIGLFRSSSYVKHCNVL